MEMLFVSMEEDAMGQSYFLHEWYYSRFFDVCERVLQWNSLCQIDLESLVGYNPQTQVERKTLGRSNPFIGTFHAVAVTGHFVLRLLLITALG